MALTNVQLEGRNKLAALVESLKTNKASYITQITASLAQVTTAQALVAADAATTGIASDTSSDLTDLNTKFTAAIAAL